MAIRKLLVTMFAAAVCVFFAIPSVLADSRKPCDADRVAVSIGVSYGDSGPCRVNNYPKPLLRGAYCTAPAYYYSSGIAHRFPRFYYTEPPHHGYGHWKKSRARRYSRYW